MAEAGPDAAPAPAPVVSLAEARQPAPGEARRPDPLWFREVEMPGREVRAEEIPSDLDEVSSGLAVLAEWLHRRNEWQASKAVFGLKRSLDRSVQELRELLKQTEVA